MLICILVRLGLDRRALNGSDVVCALLGLLPIIGCMVTGDRSGWALVLVCAGIVLVLTVIVRLWLHLRGRLPTADNT